MLESSDHLLSPGMRMSIGPFVERNLKSSGLQIVVTIGGTALPAFEPAKGLGGSEERIRRKDFSPRGR